MKKHGADRILFGTDSPWTNQAVEVERLAHSGLTDDALSKIFGDNAKKLLEI